MTKTLAVIVGISKYRAFFDDLPAASADARRVFHSLVSWGIKPENIQLLIDQEATRSSVLRSLRVWPLQKATKDLRLLFFFSGHGSRISEADRPPSSALLLSDTDPSDRGGTGILLSEIMSALARIKPREAFIFLDACSLRFDNVENILPSRLPDADLLGTTGSSCLFCMVAAGLQSAYEDIKDKSGYFTRSLLFHLAQLRNKGYHCSDLALKIEQDLISQGLPSPESYIIGSQNSWPLPDGSEIAIQEPALTFDTILRPEVTGSLQDSIVTNKGSPIWLYGKSGSGKTTLIQQLIFRNKNYAYCSLPIQENISFSGLLLRLAGDIYDSLPEIFSLQNPQNINPLEIFDILSLKLPGVVLIIDHMDRCDKESSIKLINSLKGRNYDLIFISRTQPFNDSGVVGWEMPSLDSHEIELFVEKYAPNNSLPIKLLLTMSQGTPLGIRQFLTSNITNINDFFLNNQSSTEFNRALQAAALCGGFVDESIFRKTFNLKTSDISNLEKMGLISYSGGYYLTHDSLIEKKNQITGDIKLEKCLMYWVQQILSSPQQLWACRKLISTLMELQNIDLNEINSKDIDKALLYALSSLVRIRDWEMLEYIAKKLTEYKGFLLLESSLYIAEEFVHIARHEIVELITEYLLTIDLSPNQKARLNLILGEKEFWFGNFNESINYSESVIHDSNDLNNIFRARLNKSIAEFFMGNWDSAIKPLLDILETADKFKSVETRTLGWSRMILGTTIGLRGTEVEQGKDLLLSAIRLLTQIGDDVGTAISWNNLGEMTWKLSDYRTALVQLETGLNYAVAVDDRATQLEIYRNLAHTRLRLNGRASKELEDVIILVNKFVEQVDDPTEQMQVWNTLATVAAYRLDIIELNRFIDIAYKYTEGNLEYHIYTQLNSAILYGISGFRDKSQTYLKQSFESALSGQNYLAIKQMKDDFQSIVSFSKNETLTCVLNELLSWIAVSGIQRQIDRLTIHNGGMQ